MTEREFQKQLRNYRKTQIMSVELAVELLEGCSLDCMYEDETFDALQMAIKALTIFDKIKAEIDTKCDRIDSLASVLPYTAHREIQELLCEILDLCKAESEET